MQIQDIEDSLPNGFHDALLERIDIRYENNRAIFYIQILVGDPDSKNAEEREAYRLGKLTLDSLFFCAIETPDPTYPYREKKHLRISAGHLESLTHANLPDLVQSLPENAFSCWFFIQEWNAFIYVAALDAQFIWSEDP
jgi:hypothetical protein